MLHSSANSRGMKWALHGNNRPNYSVLAPIWRGKQRWGGREVGREEEKGQGRIEHHDLEMCFCCGQSSSFWLGVRVLDGTPRNPQESPLKLLREWSGVPERSLSRILRENPKQSPEELGSSETPLEKCPRHSLERIQRQVLREPLGILKIESL